MNKYDNDFLNKTRFEKIFKAKFQPETYIKYFFFVYNNICF